MSYVLGLIGWAHFARTPEQIESTVDWHLHPDHQAIWTDVPRPRFAGGMRVVTKVVGAKVVALTGQLTTGDARDDDPIERNGRILRYRYDVRWDPRPPRWVPVEDLGAPFSAPVRSTRFISYADFLRAYRALHGDEPPRQDAA